MKNIKKLVTSITLGLLVVAGVCTTITIVNASSNQMNSNNNKYLNTEIFNIDFNKASNMNMTEWTQYLMNQGIITQEEGIIELAYYNSTNDAEKQKLYENLVDVQLKNGDLTQEEADSLKKLRHDDDSEYDTDLMFQ